MALVTRTVTSNDHKQNVLSPTWPPLTPVHVAAETESHLPLVVEAVLAWVYSHGSLGPGQLPGLHRAAGGAAGSWPQGEHQQSVSKGLYSGALRGSGVSDEPRTWYQVPQVQILALPFVRACGPGSPLTSPSPSFLFCKMGAISIRAS